MSAEGQVHSPAKYQGWTEAEIRKELCREIEKLSERLRISEDNRRQAEFLLIQMKASYERGMAHHLALVEHSRCPASYVLWLTLLAIACTAIGLLAGMMAT